jgi:ribosomal protein L11 methyltransferase
LSINAGQAVDPPVNCHPLGLDGRRLTSGMNGKTRAMRETSATTVARLSTDGATARKIGDAIAEHFEADAVAASSVEEADGRWSLALHFRDPPDEPAVRALVAAAAGDEAAAALVFEMLAATDWVRQSLDGLTPVEAGRFVVHGAHARARVHANRIGIEIEAALAFGTGHHGTTRGCLIALDRIVKGRKPRRILDIGTGTGVLAIATAKALRRPVLASDIDARAVAIACENARLNRAGAQVEAIRAAGLGRHRFRERAPYDLILANILLEPLQRLATPMARLLAPNGHVVLSGLLTAQGGAALAGYCARGLVLARRIRLEGWVTLVLRRPAISRATRSGRGRARHQPASQPRRARHRGAG